MSDIIKHNHDQDGVDRRGFLKCMAWAGTGVLWTMTGGILKSQTLSRASDAAALAAGADLSFVQMSASTAERTKPTTALRAELRGTSQRPSQGLSPGAQKDLGCFGLPAAEP